MRNGELSWRQIAVLLVTALLMPAAALLPTMTTQLAGNAGWLSMVGAIPVLVVAWWASSGGRTREGRELSAGARYTLVPVYLVWTMLVLAVALRLSSARLERVYGEPAGTIYGGVVLLLAIWMGMGKPAALARAAEIFYLALSILLAGVLLLALFRIEWRNLALETEGAVGLPKSSIMSAGLLLNVYPVVVLGRKLPAVKKRSRTTVAWVIWFGVAMTLLLMAVIGCLGARLTARIPAPFYIMIQGLGIAGGFQRMEALVAALWTLSDLVLLGMLLQTWRELASCLHAGRWNRIGVIPAAAVAWLAGWLLFSDKTQLWQFCSTALPVIGLLFGMVIPVLVKISLYKAGEKGSKSRR